MSTPLRITATLDTPTAGIEGTPFMLDGPLAWAYAQLAPADTLTPMTSTHVDDMPLPLDKWEQLDTWGWAVSRAHYDIQARSHVDIRRKPADPQFARYTTEKRHHHGLGPHKARDTTIQTAIIPTITWDALATDVDELERLLEAITHMGAHRAIGLGHVTAWHITEGQPDAWTDRPMPQPGQTAAHRPPYWHHTRRITT